MTSYQKLKLQNKDLREYVNRLLDDEETYLKEALSYRVRKELNKRALFGNHKPAGKLGYRFKGLISKAAKK